MAMKIDQAAAVEPHSVQTTVSSSVPSAVSASSTKVSMFGAKKSGFVIPKNKLSGALVPIFRAGGKADASDSTKEDTTKQVQRKTKWGTDITQDASVRRGRSLAYQTRVEQITQQLKARASEVPDDEGLQSTIEDPNDDSAGQQIDEVHKLELLELEKREAIGEILRLNPNYRAPPDYKPLLKEAKVPIPLKAYPGYNFIGLILGSEGKTQKRLEEETGAKICIHGTKSDTREKIEVSQSDAEEALGAFEELSVHISAETYEKVDAAVALIELLVTPVSGNVVPASTTSATISVDSGHAFVQIQDSATGFTMPVTAVNQGLVQPLMGLAQAGPLGVRFQPYAGAWQPHAPPQMLSHPSSGFMSAPSSAPMLNNPVQFPPASFNPFNPQLTGARPPASAGYGSFLGNSSTAVSAPQPRLLNQTMLSRSSQNYPMLGPQAQPIYPTNPARPSPLSGPPLTANQPVPIAQTTASRPLVSSMTLQATTPPLGPPSIPPLPSMSAAGNTFGWPGQLPNTLTPFRPPNTMQMTGPTVPSQRLLHGSRPVIVSAPTQQMPVAAAVRTPVSNVASQPSAPHSPAVPVSNPNLVPSFASGPSLSGASPAPMLPLPHIPAPLMALTSSAPTPPPAPPLLPSPTPRSLPMPASLPAPSPGLPPLLGQPPISMQVSSAGPLQPTVGQAPIPIPASSSQPAPVPVSGSVPSFSTIKPPVPNSSAVNPVTAPKPQRPSSSDFTFQPQRPQLPAAQNAPRPSSDPTSQSAPAPPAPGIQPPLAPQGPSFRPVGNNPPSPLGMPSLPRPRTQAPIPSPRSNSAPFPINQSAVLLQPRLPSFVNPHPAPPTTPAPQMGLLGYSSTPRVPIPSGPLPIRSSNQFHPMNQPGSLIVPNQQRGNNLSYGGGRPASNPRGTQVYDPFSPTGIPQASSQQGGGTEKVRKPEMDTEYEDLMASVGVR